MAESLCARGTSKTVSGVHDSSTGRARDCAPTVSTTARTPAAFGPRVSSQAMTRDGIALTPLGSTRTLPTVATHPCSLAAARAASTVVARAIIELDGEA